MIQNLPRYFACARHVAAYGSPTGWYVCDEKLRDKHDRPRALHDGPTTEEEARELAKMLNDGG